MFFQLLPENTPFHKRLFDLFVSINAVLILSPLMLIIGFIILLRQGFPILFRQERPGYHGKIFTIYKFRTMRAENDKHGDPLPDEKRITKIGRFLRSTSLDELPELFNVIKGEMSLVGPRPLLIAYLPLYNETQSKRHDVLPGLTGWAQIHGRNALTWQDKFDLDVWYVQHWSFWLDIKIIFQTIFKVIKREGISQPGQATAERFTGNPEKETANKEINNH
jgi:lipopolysaccharide/colanic/teichoic acid biosynthesis glycosyltransferase